MTIRRLPRNTSPGRGNHRQESLRGEDQRLRQGQGERREEEDHQNPVQNSLKESRIQSVWGSVTLSDEKVELLSDDATTTQCACLSTPASRHDRFAAEYKLQFGSGRAHDTIQKSFPKDEAKRIAQDEIKTHVFAKDEIEDGFDLTERSGRADKVSSSVTQ